ncbi:sensor histidine kinase [Paenibacillus filicis]|uniref:histidine kinase n=1 Tax=Paenibacillus gyeongsangnamensis TaxID=3388067 RepID=A0ABT4Q463_9BACL|nr:sensor histidine kinase [Paenibacillus filicis]MCZ8511662.1 sensor histidine kinase [Paenibacillus filicis]
MNIVNRFYKNVSLQIKMVVTFFLIAMIPLNALGALSYYKSTGLINDQFGKYGDYAVHQLKQSLDTNLKNMEIISNDVIGYLYNPMHQWFGDPDSYEVVVEQRNLESFLHSHNYNDLIGIYIVPADGMTIGTSQAIAVNKLHELSWWRSIPQGAQGEQWVGFHQADYYNNISYSYVLSLVVPLMKAYAIPANTRLLVDFKANAFMELIAGFEKDTDSNVVITDRAGRILYQTASESFRPRDDDVRWQESLDTNGWKIDVRVPKSTFYKSSSVIRSYTIAVGCLSLLLALLLANWFSSSLTRPLIRLIQSMNLVSNGKLETRVSVDSNDELGRLSLRFNDMTSKIQKLLQVNMRLAVKKKEAELQMLHYQINPHLMFNTLNSIQWKAKLAGMDEVPQMIFHLTQLLENSLTSTAELVSFEQELSSIEHFLKIQGYRYGSVFTYRVEGDDSLRDCLIPRMTLQPLLENIFYHGFTDGRGDITLTMCREGEIGLLLLKDNGRGIPAEQVPKVIRPGTPRKGRGGLGLFNVHEKFQLHYGESYGLAIDSQLGKGTTVSIRWPLYKEETVDAG